MITAVVVVESGCVSETFTKEGGEVMVIDLDTLESMPECPLCTEGLDDGDSCSLCGVNWGDFDIEDIAVAYLR